MEPHGIDRGQMRLFGLAFAGLVAGRDELALVPG
jgi:hypothetical protein